MLPLTSHLREVCRKATGFTLPVHHFDPFSMLLYNRETWDDIYIYIPVEPHEAVPEVSKGKVHITQNKHVPIEWFVTTASQSRI